MTSVFVMFYLSFAGIVFMLVLRMKKVVLGPEENDTHMDLTAVGEPIVRKLSAVKRAVGVRARMFMFVLARAFLEKLFSVYKAGGGILLRAREKMAHMGRERKINQTGQVSNYMKDVLEHKESLRNGNEENG